MEITSNGTKHYPGLGTTFPSGMAARQTALAEQMKRKEGVEQRIVEKLKAKREKIYGEQATAATE